MKILISAEGIKAKKDNKPIDKFVVRVNEQKARELNSKGWVHCPEWMLKR